MAGSPFRLLGTGCSHNAQKSLINPSKRMCADPYRKMCNGLKAAMVVSAQLFCYGLSATPVGQHRSQHAYLK